MVRHVFGAGDESWAVRLPGLGPGGRAWLRSKVVRRSHRHGLARFGFGDASSAVRLPGLGPGRTRA